MCLLYVYVIRQGPNQNPLLCIHVDSYMFNTLHPPGPSHYLAYSRRLCEETWFDLASWLGLSRCISSSVGCPPLVFHILLWRFKFVVSCLKMLVAYDYSLWPILKEGMEEKIGILFVFVLVIHKNPRSLLNCQDRDRIFSLWIFAPNKHFCEAGVDQHWSFHFFLRWFWKSNAVVEEIKEGLLLCKCFYLWLTSR